MPLTHSMCRKQWRPLRESRAMDESAASRLLGSSLLNRRRESGVGRRRYAEGASPQLPRTRSALRKARRAQRSEGPLVTRRRRLLRLSLVEPAWSAGYVRPAGVSRTVASTIPRSIHTRPTDAKYHHIPWSGCGAGAASCNAQIAACSSSLRPCGRATAEWYELGRPSNNPLARLVSVHLNAA